MRRNEPWLPISSKSSYSRGSHFGSSGLSIALALKVILVIVVLAIVGSIVQFLRPVPPPEARATLTGSYVPGAKPSLPWPPNAGGEVVIQNVGTVGSLNADKEFPLGSVAKMITALVVIKDHPLALGATGPTIPVSQSDVALYQTMQSQQDSVIPVTLGEPLNEYELLEALLVPSANNFADMAANWDAGSNSAFLAKMNAYVKSLGLHRTVLQGPSGLNPHTVGSAHDQIVIAQEVLKNPILSQIVAQPQVTLPNVGVVYNIDYNVGHNGFLGIATGTMGGGGNFVFAATGTSNSKDAILGAILGDPGVQPLISALNEGTALVNGARRVPNEIEVLNTSQTVAQISVPGMNPVRVRPAKSVLLVAWPGLKVNYHAAFSKLKSSMPAGSKVGTVTVSIGNQSQTVPLVTEKPVGTPSIKWRLTRL